MNYDRLIIFLILASFVVFLAINLLTPLRMEGDGVFYYSWLRSAALDHDFDFANELEHFAAYDRGSRWILTENIRTYLGKVPNAYAYGTAVMWAPFWLAAHSLTIIFGGPAAGYAASYVLAINFASWLFGALALVIIYLGLKKFFTAAIAFGSAVGIYLATPLVYYQFWEPSMSHSASVFLVSLFFYLVIKIFRREAVNWLVLAAVVFLLVATRWQNLLFLSVLLPLLWQYRRQWQLNFRIITATAMPAGLFWLTQFWLWRQLYGRYLLLPQGSNFVRPEFHGLYILFSSNRGLLLWSPLIILALAGFYYLWHRSHFLFTTAVLAVGAQWLINGSLNDLGGGDAFGARRFVESLPFLAFALAAFGDNFKFKKVGLIITGVLIIFNFSLIEGYRRGLIPHQGEFSVVDIIRTIW